MTLPSMVNKILNFASSIENIILTLRNNKVEVILSGMQLPLNYGEPYRQKFREMYVRLAKKHSLTLIPFLLEGVALNPDLNLGDGLHPNEKGQEIIAKTVYKYLKPILSKKKA